MDIVTQADKRLQCLSVVHCAVLMRLSTRTVQSGTLRVDDDVQLAQDIIDRDRISPRVLVAYELLPHKGFPSLHGLDDHLVVPGIPEVVFVSKRLRGQMTSAILTSPLSGMVS